MTDHPAVENKVHFLARWHRRARPTVIAPASGQLALVLAKPSACLPSFRVYTRKEETLKEVAVSLCRGWTGYTLITSSA